MLLERLVFSDLHLLDEFRQARNKFMQVPSNPPFFTIEHFLVKISAVVKIDDCGELGLAINLRLWERILGIEEYLELEVLF